MNPIPEKEHRIRVGITHGDLNGISYEIIIKTLQDQRMLELYTIIVYGSSKVASYHRKTLNINEFNFNLIKKADMASKTAIGGASRRISVVLRKTERQITMNQRAGSRAVSQ